jgi:tRNA(Ile)-lysidine synthase
LIVRIRQALAGADWIDAGALAKAAVHLAEADAALEWAAEREYGARGERGDGADLSPGGAARHRAAGGGAHYRRD